MNTMSQTERERKGAREEEGVRQGERERERGRGNERTLKNPLHGLIIK